MLFCSINPNKFLFMTPKFLFTDFDKICSFMQGSNEQTYFQELVAVLAEHHCGCRRSRLSVIYSSSLSFLGPHGCWILEIV